MIARQGDHRIKIICHGLEIKHIFFVVPASFYCLLLSLLILDGKPVGKFIWPGSGPGWPWHGQPELNDRVLESKDAGGKEQESHGKEPEQPSEEPTPEPEEEPEEGKEKDEVKTEERLISEMLEFNLWKFEKVLKGIPLL